MTAPHPIHALSSDFVDRLAALEPTLATHLGMREHDDRWRDLSPAGWDRLNHYLVEVKARIEGLPAADDPWDRLAVDVLLEAVDESIATHRHGDHLELLNSISTPVQTFREIFDTMPKDDPAAWEAVCARLEKLPDAVAGYRELLEHGRRSGRVVARRQARAAAAQCRNHAGDRSALDRLPGELAASGVAAPAARLEAAVATAKAAFGELGEYLEGEYAPDARTADGVGRDRYIRAAREFLGTDIDPEETYAWGWTEVEQLRERMRQVADTIHPGMPLGEVMASVKQELVAPDHGAFAAAMEERLDRALADLTGTHFEVPEAARRVTVRLAPPGGPLGAYYVPPSEDFSRAGSVWWSLGEDGPVPLWDQVSTAYHEGFPGHHLQVATVQTLADRLSRAHRLLVWYPGTGEGWALYAERLMDEWGYLDRPEFVLGYLAGAMLRACRVVIDIGIHLGVPIPSDQPFHPGAPWTFDTAVELLLDYAGLDRPYAESETLRYFGWPGQAIAYKVGEREILRIREELERRRGPAFDEQEFHRHLLEVGSVGLDTLRTWMLAG